MIDLTEMEEQLGVCEETVVMPQLVLAAVTHVCILPEGHEGSHVFEEYA